MTDLIINGDDWTPQRQHFETVYFFDLPQAARPRERVFRPSERNNRGAIQHSAGTLNLAPLFSRRGNGLYERTGGVQGGWQ